MSDGYTYTTISTRPGEPTRIAVSFYLDAAAWIVVPGAGTDRPHLSISHGDVSVTDRPAHRRGHRRGREDRAEPGRPGRRLRR